MGKIGDEIEWVVFANANAAREFSERVIDRHQTAETKRDPNTRTDYMFPWSINSETGRASCKVPTSFRRYLTEPERAQLKTDAQAETDKDIDADGRLAMKPTRVRPQAPGGGGGGSRGR